MAPPPPMYATVCVFFFQDIFSSYSPLRSYWFRDPKTQTVFSSLYSLEINYCIFELFCGLKWIWPNSLAKKKLLNHDINFLQKFLSFTIQPYFGFVFRLLRSRTWVKIWTPRVLYLWKQKFSLFQHYSIYLQNSKYLLSNSEKHTLYNIVIFNPLL